MLAAEIMGFYITDLSADTVTAKKNTRQRSRQAKTDPSKNRVRNFFSISRSRIGNFPSQPVETHREKRSTPTKTVLDISLFLSRDPIGERGFQLPSVLESLQSKALQFALANSDIRCSKCTWFGAQQEAVFRDIQVGNPVYVFVNNNPVGAYDAFGLLPCPPGQIRDPKCVKDCQLTRYLEFAVASGAYTAGLFVCAFAPTPPLKLACITAATILYGIEVASIEKGFRDCIDGCPCVCP